MHLWDDLLLLDVLVSLCFCTTIAHPVTEGGNSIFLRLLGRCQHPLHRPLLALQWRIFGQSKWLVIQVFESTSLFDPCWTFFFFSFGPKFGDASLPGDWATVALSIYMDFALISVLRCFIIIYWIPLPLIGRTLLREGCTKKPGKSLVLC